jgi:ribosomal protein S18 acetylase RimI-like enzyme
MFIRPVERPDRDQILQLLKQRETFNETEIRVAMEVLDEGLRYPDKGEYQMFCAIDDSGCLAGYICFGPIPMTDGCYDLYWIVVDKKFSRKGVGEKLLDVMEEFLTMRGARHVYVDTETTPPYEAARSFYKKHGYREVCMLDNFYRKGANKVIFMKEVQRVVHPNAT